MLYFITPTIKFLFKTSFLSHCLFKTYNAFCRIPGHHEMYFQEPRDKKPSKGAYLLAGLAGLAIANQALKNNNRPNYSSYPPPPPQNHYYSRPTQYTQPQVYTPQPSYTSYPTHTQQSYYSPVSTSYPTTNYYPAYGRTDNVFVPTNPFPIMNTLPGSNINEVPVLIF